MLSLPDPFSLDDLHQQGLYKEKYSERVTYSITCDMNFFFSHISWLRIPKMRKYVSQWYLLTHINVLIIFIIRHECKNVSHFLIILYRSINNFNWYWMLTWKRVLINMVELNNLILWERLLTELVLMLLRKVSSMQKKY